MTTTGLEPFIADDNVDVHICTGAKTFNVGIHHIIVHPDPEMVEQGYGLVGQESTGEELLYVTFPIRDLPSGIHEWRSSKHIAELLEDMALPFWAEQLVRNVVDMAESSLPLLAGRSAA